jgi:hypothetical protein
MTLPVWHLVAALLLAAIVAAFGVSIAFVFIEGAGPSVLGALAFYLIPSFIVVLVGGIIIGLPVHFVVFRRAESINPVTVAMAGAIAGGLSAFILFAVLGSPSRHVAQLSQLGSLVGLLSGCVWWAAVLRPLKENIRNG